MKETINKLDKLLISASNFIKQIPEEDMSIKPSNGKWSKKEILGHLIDSAVNNLQRFTEIQFMEKPYVIRNYKQSELVTANGYQTSQVSEILGFWLAINYRIIHVMSQQSEETLNYKIDLGAGGISDLRFLMADYVEHLEHHVGQIIEL